MKRDCTPVCGLFSLKYYKRNNVITFPSKVIHLQLYQLSPSDSLKHIKLISKALITEPDKHLDFSLKSYKQKQCELCVPLEQAFPPICMKPQSPLSDHQILKANSALRANGGRLPSWDIEPFPSRPSLLWFVHFMKSKRFSSHSGSFAAPVSAAKEEKEDTLMITQIRSDYLKTLTALLSSGVGIRHLAGNLSTEWFVEIWFFFLWTLLKIKHLRERESWLSINCPLPPASITVYCLMISVWKNCVSIQQCLFADWKSLMSNFYHQENTDPHPPTVMLLMILATVII